MANPDIEGRIRLNSKPARQGLQEVEKAVSKLKKVFSFASKAFGTLFLIDNVKQLIRELFTFTSEITQIAGEYKITAEQAQKLLQISSELNQPHSKIVETMNAAGVSIGHAVDRMSDLKKEAALTAGEIRDIETLRKTVEKTITGTKVFFGRMLSGPREGMGKATPNLFTMGGLDAPEIRRAVENAPKESDLPVVESEAARMMKQIEAQAEANKQAQKSGGGKMFETLQNRANELQRIGAFSGLRDPVVQINKQQLEELRKLNDKVSKGQLVNRESIYQ